MLVILNSIISFVDVDISFINLIVICFLSLSTPPSFHPSLSIQSNVLVHI